MFEIEASYPNPFSRVTTLGYSLFEAGQVSLEVFDVLGHRIATLLTKQDEEAGRHSVVWDGESQTGAKLPSGTYFYRVRVGGGERVGQVVMAR